MADIELVIKIPEETYKDIQSKDWKNEGKWYSEEWKAIHNGTPLPKGHGRLMILSEDAVKREQCAVSFSCQNWISEVGLSNATVAIIEADEKYEAKVITRGNCMMCGKELTEGLFFCKECEEKANSRQE